MFARILKVRYLVPLAVVGILMTTAYAFTLPGNFTGSPEIASEATANFVAVNVSNTHLSEDLNNDNDEITDYHFCLTAPTGTSLAGVSIEVELVNTSGTSFDAYQVNADSSNPGCYIALFHGNSNLTIASVASEEVSVHS